MIPEDSNKGRGVLEAHVHNVCKRLVAECRRDSLDDAAAGALVRRAHDTILAAISRALVDDPEDRTDEWGRARAGSQLQMKLWTNLFSSELSEAIRQSSADLQGAAIEWVSPLARDHYLEYRDGMFLDRLGLDHLRAELVEFWPARGPRWDALATTLVPGTSGDLAWSSATQCSQAL